STIVWYCIIFRDDFHEEVEALKSDIGAELFVVEAGDDASFDQDSQITSKDKIIRIPRWRGTDSEVLGPIADAICKIAPADTSSAVTWPTRRIITQSSMPARSCNQIDYPADVIIMLDSSENFSPEEFDKMKESVAELVDAGFDLSPDVARIGFVVYSDKVAVPVALGHYEDNIDLIQQISDTEKINDGVAIALYGLNAARQQFQLHGRENATRIVIMITNGRNRGNAAPAAEDLRNIYNVQLFILAVAADAEGLATLKRIAGSEYPDRVYEVATAFELDDQAAAISRHLCGYTTPAHGITPTETPFRRTTKRDVSAASYTPYPWGGPHAMKFPPLCSDGIKRPYQFNILVDVTARSSPEDFRLALDHLSQFFQKRFAPDDNMLLFNIMTVNSKKVLDARASLMVGEVSYSLNDITQNIDDDESA
ncbi:von Willebrand factor type A domain protein, partial [Ostertagia ostertagi]